MAHDHYRSTTYQPAGSLRTYRIVSWCVGERWYAEVHDQTTGGWMSLARYGPAPDRDAVERLARREACVRATDSRCGCGVRCQSRVVRRSPPLPEGETHD
jgi:hypothetical protein